MMRPRIGRTLPPASATISFADIITGIKGIVSGNKVLRRREAEIRSYLGVDHCFMVSSGKAALTVILKALHRLQPKRTDVIIPAFVCYSVPSAVIRADLQMLLCDMDPATLFFDRKDITKRIQEHADTLLAVVSPHLFGLPADIDFLKGLVAGTGAVVIEDAAQSMGGRINGKMAGTLGDVGFFSLGRGKPVTAVEGGVIVTNNAPLAQAITEVVGSLPAYTMTEILALFAKALLLRCFGIPGTFWFPKALPFLRVGATIFEPAFSIKRMSSFQAGVLANWEKRLHRDNELRNRNSRQLSLRLKKNRVIKTYSNGEGPHGSAVTLRYPVRAVSISNWGKLLKESERQGLGIMLTYPEPVHQIAELKGSFNGASYPGAETLASELLTLPVHPFVTDADYLKIEKLISNIFCHGHTQTHTDGYR